MPRIKVDFDRNPLFRSFCLCILAYFSCWKIKIIRKFFNAKGCINTGLFSFMRLDFMDSGKVRSISFCCIKHLVCQLASFLLSYRRWKSELAIESKSVINNSHLRYFWEIFFSWSIRKLDLNTSRFSLAFNYRSFTKHRIFYLFFDKCGTWLYYLILFIAHRYHLLPQGSIIFGSWSNSIFNFILDDRFNEVISLIFKVIGANKPSDLLIDSRLVINIADY